VLVLLCGGYWYFFYQPATDQIAELESSIDTLDTQIAKYRKQVQKLPQLKDNLDDQKEILAHAQTLLPKDKHAVEKLLAEIERLGQSENVAFLSFDPGSTSKHDLYATRTLSIKLEGPFHNLMQFFSRISSLNTLITIESLDLSPVNKEPGEEIVISSSVQLFVYRALNK
jgi:type IV pilus assembly protein PilO